MWAGTWSAHVPACCGSWPAPGYLQKSRVWCGLTETSVPDVASLLQLALTALLDRLNHRFHAWPRLTALSQIPTSNGPWSMSVSPQPNPPPSPHLTALAFVTLPEHVCVFWASSHDQFMNTHRVGERCNYSSATAQHAEGQLWGTRGHGPQSHALMSVNMGQWYRTAPVWIPHGCAHAAEEVVQLSTSFWGEMLFNRGAKSNEENLKRVIRHLWSILNIVECYGRYFDPFTVMCCRPWTGFFFIFITFSQI